MPASKIMRCKNIILNCGNNTAGPLKNKTDVIILCILYMEDPTNILDNIQT